MKTLIALAAVACFAIPTISAWGVMIQDISLQLDVISLAMGR